MSCKSNLTAIAGPTLNPVESTVAITTSQLSLGYNFSIIKSIGKRDSNINLGY